MTASKPQPAPLHTDEIRYAQRVNDGRPSAAWDEVVGDEANKAAKIAIIAWEQVRDPADPIFPACSMRHRERLLAEVEGLLKAGPPIEEARTPFIDAAISVLAKITEAEQRQLTGETVEGDN